MGAFRFGTLLLFLLLLTTGFARAQDEDPKKLAYEYAKQGLDLVDKGKLDEALVVFQKGYALDSTNSDFQYEIAVIWYLKKEYSRTIEILEKVLNKPDVNDQYYQILGNAYDLSGQTGKARKTYASGLKRFPASGVLYLESGVLEYMHKNTPDAVKYWESGVVADPAFNSNYYWLARYYASTPEKVWAALYGEVFIAMERNTERTQEISALLNQVYTSAIHWSKDPDSITVKFTLGIVQKPKSGEKLPFGQLFQECMKKAADSLSRAGTDSLNYDALCKLRGLFILYWFRGGYQANNPIVVFDWINKFPEPYYMECYHRWLFLKGNEKAFESWYYAQPETYGAFVKWFKKNPVLFNKDNYFSKSKY